jgi:hypothetical protein
VLNDALPIYFADAPLANAFVARWQSHPQQLGRLNLQHRGELGDDL